MTYITTILDLLQPYIVIRIQVDSSSQDEQVKYLSVLINHSSHMFWWQSYSNVVAIDFRGDISPNPIAITGQCSRRS